MILNRRWSVKHQLDSQNTQQTWVEKIKKISYQNGEDRDVDDGGVIVEWRLFAGGHVDGFEGLRIQRTSPWLQKLFGQHWREQVGVNS